MAQGLTDKSIKALLIPPPKRQKDYVDTSSASPPGFGIRVSYTGTKSFYLKYDANGRRNQRLTFGRYPALGLADAREMARRVYKTVAAGQDPQADKMESRRSGDFRSVWERFYADQAKRLKPKTIQEWKRIIEKDVLPVFGKRPPQDISRGDVKALIKQVSKRGDYISNRTFDAIRRVFFWAVEEEILENSPCFGIRKSFNEKPHERVLNTSEIRKIVAALTYERPMIAAAFRLWLLTGMRKSELLRSKWAHIDWDRKILTLPNAKNNRDYLLPLSRETQKYLRGLEPLTGHSEWVFLGPTGANVQNPQKAKARIQMASGVQFRINDLRHTVGTGLAELRVRAEIVSAVMNHTPPGPAVTRVYNRYEPIEEMRQALEKWSRHLDKILS